MSMRDMVDTACTQAASQGVSPLAWHLTQWLEEVDEYSVDDNLLMAGVASALASVGLVER